MYRVVVTSARRDPARFPMWPTAREPRHEPDSAMTSTIPDTHEQDRQAQMAEALIAHLGTPAAAFLFADRQVRQAEGTALTTWAAISDYLQRHQDPN